METTDRQGRRLDETLKLRITSEMRARIQARAIAERRSEAAIGRLALEEYLDAEQQRAAA